MSEHGLRGFARRLSRSWALFAALGLVVGLLVAPYALSVTSSPSGTIAVVPIEGGIDGGSAAAVSESLQQARSDPSIDAVVLVSNSPGGGASASETMYLEVSRTAEELPVVASVDAMAASGAYYAVAPSDYVYAKPSSLVGSVGVYTMLPADPQPIDEVVASGPEKLSGGDERDWAYKTESLRRAFVGAVFESRGENLTISRAELSEAGLYTGAQAVQNGMVDEVGGTGAAIREAARRAGLDDYGVEVLRGDGDAARFISRANYVASDAPDKELVSPSYFVGDLREDPAVPTVVMLPGSVLTAALDDRATPATDRADRLATHATNESGRLAPPAANGSDAGEGGP